MSTESKISYLQELTRNLLHGGFTVGPETTDRLLPVGLDGQRLCVAMDSGAIRYQKATVADDPRREALERVIDIAGTTKEYVSSLAAAPLLTAEGLTGDYRLLAEFNNIVLAGHPTRYGTQFVTWERTQDHTLHQGDYHGPGRGDKCYLAAKKDFAVRAGLIPRSALFTQEQLVEIYRSVHETLENACPLTDERQKRL